uniref:Uncharacterized protein n=1 Tax=Arundo donax TaxID=35708 RepID=A0A0A8ZH25_ARUDO
MERKAELCMCHGLTSTKCASESKLVRAESAPHHGNQQSKPQLGLAIAYGAGHHGSPGHEVPVRHFVEQVQRAGEEAAPGVEDEEVVHGEGVAGHAELYGARVELRANGWWRA